VLRIFTFGGLLIEQDGAPLQLPTQKARDLVAYLVTFRDRRHSRSLLAGLLWPDLPEEKARRRLSDTLWRVRRALGDYVAADEEFIWLNTDFPCWLDVGQFQTVLADLRLETSSLEPVEKALALYRGPFLDGFYHEWALLERERLQGLYLEALGAMLDFYKQAGDYAAALTIAQRLIAVEPLQEAAHRELMRLYHLLGRDAEAIAQYHRCRRILQEEIGVAPAPETESLYQILSQRLAPDHEVDTSKVHLPFAAHRPVPDLDEPPLVGRDAERALLLGHLEEAASGRGGMVLLEGEPGIGKTRLAKELVAGARWRNVRVFMAQARQGHGASYGLLVAALEPALTPLRIRQLARLVEPEHLQVVVLLFPSIGQVLPELPSPSDLPQPQARERMRQALVTVILTLCHIVPCLWVLEDLQWADVETLSLLPLLLPRLGRSRAFFLLTGRSVELRAAPAVWEVLQALDRAGPFPRYVLSRLDVEEIGRLLHDLLGEEHPALSDHLARESGGVPLYLVETLKAWRDEGYLQPTERGTWCWVGEVPASLSPHPGEAVIDHRLSRLSSAARELLAVAAVIGPEVDFDLLASVCMLPLVDRATPDLYLLASDELLRLGLLVETDIGYRFSHDRVCQMVYHRLPPSKRRRLHHRVARAMETLFPDRCESLAHHFVAAGERQPAIHYLLRAAEHAREVFAHEAALDCYDRLLALLLSPEDRLARFDVLCDRAEVLGWIGDREAQGHALEEMLSLARTLADDVRLARALHLRSEWHRIQGMYQPANEDAREALRIHRRLGDDHARARLLSQLGRNRLYVGECDQAEAYFQEALPILKATGDLKGQIECLMGQAYIAQYRGNLSTALSFCRRSLALAEETGDRQMLSYTLSAVGLGYIDLGDMDGAEPYLQRALQVAEASGEKRLQAVTHVRLAHISLNREDLETARARLWAGLQMLREVRDAPWEAYTLSVLGEVELLQGRYQVAREYLEAAYRLHLDLGEHDNAAVSLSYLAVAELAMGEEDLAWKHSQQVMRKAEAEWPGTECCPEVPYNCFLVAEGTRRWAAARAALEKAARVVVERTARIGDLTSQEKYRTGLRVHRAIAEALAQQPPPGQLRVRLARADAPGRGRLAPGETVTVVWTVDAGEEDAAFLKREGKVALRRHRILRLLAEAEAAGALPTVADLAGALDVSPRTVRADLAALRQQGHAVRTRGRRS